MPSSGYNSLKDFDLLLEDELSSASLLSKDVSSSSSFKLEEESGLFIHSDQDEFEKRPEKEFVTLWNIVWKIKIYIHQLLI